MNATTNRFANRCLPLLMANEAGWTLLNPVAFIATWSGGPAPTDLRLEYDETVAQRPMAESNFGYGIVSWSVPLLFRTPPGYNLLARGPVNLPKDGASALEGLVETDWSVATFTMNWKLTRADHAVRFEAEEPFCMVVPQRRGELERFRPVHRDLSTVPEVKEGVKAFQKGRVELQKRKFVADFLGPRAKAWDEWEGIYFRGRYPDGGTFRDHQTKLRLRAFADERVGAEGSVETRAGAPSIPEEAKAELEVPGTVYITSEAVRFRSFSSATVVLNLQDGGYFELNAVAGRMLELLSLSWPAGKVADLIARHYGQPIEVVQQDIHALADQLLDLGVLETAKRDDAGS
jgi:Family of unknown function (DUF6065)/Coenzyme PQQ synthesis protein D (PqqD)